MIAALASEVTFNVCADCGPDSLMEEVIPLYILGTILFFIVFTLKRALVGRPRLTLFHIGR